jgi:hypothetical protein
MSIDTVVLSEDRQLELKRIAQSRSLPTGYVFRARLILMLAGISNPFRLSFRGGASGRHLVTI